MEQFIDVSRRELAWEVDYIREAKCAKRFRYDGFYYHVIDRSCVQTDDHT